MPSVDINIRGRETGLAQAFNSAQRRVAGFSQGIASAASGVRGFVAAIGRIPVIGTAVAAVGLAVGGLAAAFQRTLTAAVDFADEIDKAADRAGVSTDAFQALRLQAELGGSTFRGAALALQRFTRRLGEAAGGSGTLLRQLDRFGINLRNQNGTLRDSEDVLDDYVGKVRDLGNAQEQNAALFAAFDAEGLAFGRALVNQTETVDELVARYREMGVILDRQLIVQAVEAKDQMTLLNAQFQVAKTEVGLQLIPVFQDLIPLLTNMAGQALAVANAIGDILDARADEGLRDELEDVQNQIQVIINRRDALEEQSAGRVSLTARETERLGELVRREGELSGQLEANSQRRTRALEGRVRATTALNNANQTARELAEAQLASEDRNREVQTELLRLKLEQGRITQEEYDIALARLNNVKEEEAAEKTITELAQARIDQEMAGRDLQREVLRLKLEQGIIDQEEYQRLLDRLEGKMAEVEVGNDLADAARKRAEEEARIEEIQRTELRLAQELGGVLAGFEDSTRGWLNVLTGVVGALRQARDAGTSLAGVFGGQGNIGGFLSAFAGGGRFPGRQFGGPVSPGTAYLVGERGPELFVPRIAGNVRPGANAAGGGVTNINLGATTYVGNVTDAVRRANAAELRLQALAVRQYLIDQRVQR